MTEWTEDWVREAVGWKPFKEGKTLQSSGQVADFKRRENICQGVIKEGRQTLRPTVKVLGPTDIRVQCGCVENRATGAVCAHAVAVLLTAIAASSKSPAPSPAPVSARHEAPAKAVETFAPAAWDIRFSPRFASELSVGKLSVRLTQASGEPGPIDIRLSAWLPPGNQKIRTLQLSGDDLAAFLDVIAGHPRIAREGEQRVMSVSEEPGAPLSLEDSTLSGTTVKLRIAADSGTLFRWGQSAALISGQAMYRLPAASDKEDWHRQVKCLIDTGSLQLSTSSFLESFDSWSDLFASPAPGWLGDIKLAAEDPVYHLNLDGTISAIKATLSVEYPGCRSVPLPEAHIPIPGLPRLADSCHVISRSQSSEKQAVRKLRILGFELTDRSGHYRLNDEYLISAFLADGIRDLSRTWKITTTSQLNQSLKGLKVIRPVIEQKGGNGDLLAFELSFQTNDGTHIPPQEIRRLLGASRAKPGGQRLLVSRDCEEVVLPLASELQIGRIDAPFLLQGAAARAFQNVRDYISKSRVSSESHIHQIDFSGSGLQADLRSYQAAGASWIVHTLDALDGGLLSDEMGLGKTIQSIASIVRFNHLEPETNAVLVVVPTSLIGNWMEEIKRFAPGLVATALHGSGRDKFRAKALAGDIIVTSYSTLVRDLAFHLQQEYGLVVADEASILRNSTTDIAKSMYKLRAKRRLALTGTPVENRLRDVWSIFRFISPGYLGSLSDFQERYEPPAGADLSPGALQRLKLRISPFVLRRTKEEVAGDLPEKIEIDEWLDLEPDQAKLYAGIARAGLAEIDRLRDNQGESAGRMHLLTLLLRLRQICVDPALIRSGSTDEKAAEASVKIDRLKAILSERSDSQKTLIFSQFSSNLRNIKEHLGNQFGAVFSLDGSTRNRSELVSRFQNEPGAAVFLISIKAGGYGLNLTAADTVIHMDPWWNPAVEAQATDRAHRIGQTKPVTVYRLLTKDTVEERVRRMQDQKRAIIAATTGNADDESPSNWSLDDLEGLLR